MLDLPQPPSPQMVIVIFWGSWEEDIFGVWIEARLGVLVEGEGVRVRCSVGGRKSEGEGLRER